MRSFRIDEFSRRITFNAICIFWFHPLFFCIQNQFFPCISLKHDKEIENTKKEFKKVKVLIYSNNNQKKKEKNHLKKSEQKSINVEKRKAKVKTYMVTCIVNQIFIKSNLYLP